MEDHRCARNALGHVARALARHTCKDQQGATQMRLWMKAIVFASRAFVLMHPAAFVLKPILYNWVVKR
jgi:hypothetical protein